MPDQYGPTTQEWAEDLQRTLDLWADDPFYGRDYPDADASLYDENGQVADG